MIAKLLARVQHWLYTQQDVILFAIVVALTLYMIAFSVDNKLARRSLMQRISALEAEVQKLKSWR